ncbi:protein MODIFIER OF SNC1 1 isoform X1 [Zea mays]|uniref:Modifier of snc1 n=5 Tax=Zea mays TaxID=4577 RepID=A0A1D6KDE7_MAIZE|nr:protein MODIFIER OF SNC1 1 isoform X1 [Zea mays]ONM01252.1 modifier of snc1 [Zea mays]ONM01255.1 modifier of snc1 [Zea mays]ONM01259.1 modifier of snc1 [Zea mays]ONM01261.1 modifier of snc1 [Zea mays]ONM01262.1 modifier of snc1 [Zea mays]|eukprot:XP_008660522.1 protein MODIFIER OF SNC1 1 isoform X1 [Zea mays]
MASSLLTTDRRWGATPARKSGMTVLGKVPKPINLPSQRLENNGLDPNLELVPKGTHTWGSKAPSTTPNAWSSSSILSTKNDGSSSSSSHFNGRPSSGGGSRPSTAGSEPLGSPNAWGPNSRPSSASGTFPSSHLPMATNRPRSAETRPGSSQLSRFADNASDNVKASIRTIDRPGSSSHGPGFTLSTGDFPTLGSEANSQRGHSSKGRPISSSGKEVSQGEQVKSLTTGNGELISQSNNQPVDIMKTEQHAHTGGAPVLATNVPNEGLQPRPYPPNFPMPHPQFDSWRAPPGHPPEGMWHRGLVPGGPYRPVGPPGSFPVEPFGYYGQFPPNSEVAARQGPGHGGYQAKNGDVYHPTPPNSYIMNQPVIPVRPVYQGPVPYDGYYGPRAHFNNANVRDPHFVGGPGILNQFPNQNDRFHPGHPQNRPGRHETVPREQLEYDKIHVFHRGNPGSLHDNSDRLGGSREFERNAQPASPLLPHPDGNRTDVNMRTDTRDTFSESERTRVLTKSVPNQRGSVGTEHLSVYDNAHSHHRETGDGTLRKKFKEDGSAALHPVIKKNAALIEKIESLNNKARNVDARNLPESASSKEFNKHKKSTDVSSNDVMGMACKSDPAVSVSCVSPAVQRLPNVPIKGTILGPAHPQLTEFSKAEKLGDSISDHVHRKSDSSRNSYHGPSKDRPANKFGSHGRGESSTTDLRNNIDHGQQPEIASQLQPAIVPDDMPASLDYESQRAKMKELAAERAKKLKAEEEERIKNQKAKALAKLEELNRRSSVLQKKSNDIKVETYDAHDKQHAGLDVTAKLDTSTEPHDVIAPDRLTDLLPPNDPNHTMVHIQAQSTAQSHALDGGKDPDAHATSSLVKNTHSNMEPVVQKSISQLHDITVVKAKQGYRKRHVSEEKISDEKASASITTRNITKNVDVLIDTVTAVVAPHDDPPTQNKKGTRHLRSKKKLDDAPVTSKHPPVVLNEPNTVKVSTEPKTHTGGVIISSSIVPTEGTIVTVGSITVGGISLKPMNQERVKSPDGTNNTESSQPRPQQTRKSGKHQHVLRPVEKPHGNDGILCAPVKPPVPNEHSDGAMPTAAVADLTKPVGKAINDGENVTRTKRAEMERYVPKPMSKELQQQNPSDDKEAVDKPSGAKSHPAAEPKKTSKAHGGKSNPSWRKRNPDESALVAPNSVEQADVSYESKEVQNFTYQKQPVELGKQDTQLKFSVDAAAENSSAPVQTVPLSVGGAKQHSAANRQRRQHVKAQRNEASGYSNESKGSEGKNDVVYQSATPVMDSNSSNHRNVPRSDVKNSGVVSHSRAWKPKTNSHPQDSSDGKIAVDGQVDSHGGRLEMNTSKGSDTITHLVTSSEPTKRSDGKEVSHSKHENLAREDGNQKGETEQEQANPTLRRQGQPNARYHRGGGSHRGRGGYDTGRPNHVTNVERRKGGSHLEYQPVGPQNKAADFQQSLGMEERTEGPPASGQAFRQRGHNRGLRPAGRFVQRNPASTPTTNSHQNE